MRPFSQVLTLFLVFVALSQNVQAGRCCACARDDGKGEVFFKLGCQAFFLRHTVGCSTKKTFNLETTKSGDFTKWATDQCPNGPLQLYYMGHDGGSIKLFDDVLTLLESGRNIDIEDPTCTSLPTYIELIAQNQGRIQKAKGHLKFKGYQEVTVGGWDPFLPGKNNVWGTVDPYRKRVRLADCEDFVGRGCFSAGDLALCFLKGRGPMAMMCGKAKGDGSQNFNRKLFQFWTYVSGPIGDMSPDQVMKYLLKDYSPKGWTIEGGELTPKSMDTESPTGGAVQAD